MVHIDLSCGNPQSNSNRKQNALYSIIKISNLILLTCCPNWPLKSMVRTDFLELEPYGQPFWYFTSQTAFNRINLNWASIETNLFRTGLIVESCTHLPKYNCFQSICVVGRHHNIWNLWRHDIQYPLPVNLWCIYFSNPDSPASPVKSKPQGSTVSSLSYKSLFLDCLPFSGP